MQAPYFVHFVQFVTSASGKLIPVNVYLLYLIIAAPSPLPTDKWTESKRKVMFGHFSGGEELERN